MKRCLTAGLLILDDFAFRLYSQMETELLYTLSDERLGEASIIVTSNRPPEDWFSVFPDPIVGGAIMDRLASGAVNSSLRRDAPTARRERGGRARNPNRFRLDRVRNPALKFKTLGGITMTLRGNYRDPRHLGHADPATTLWYYVHESLTNTDLELG